MEKDQEKEYFIDRFKNIYKNVTGFETYGETTEFYDEDGVVLMVVNDFDVDKSEFIFTDTRETFEFSKVKDQELAMII